MKTLPKPKNQWATALWIINQQFDTGVNMVDVLKRYDPFYYKFSTRLGEIEVEYPTLNLLREIRVHKSRLTGKTTHYTHYTPKCSQSYLYNLYHQINEGGFKGKTNKPSYERLPAEGNV